jgi:hypothetical protein
MGVAMFAYAQLHPGKDFRLGPALKYYAHRFVGVPSVRRAISSLIAASLRRRHGDVPQTGHDHRAMEAADDLECNGLAILDPLLSTAQVDRMVEYFMSRDVVGPGDIDMPFKSLPEGAAAAAYRLDTVLACPDILSALNAPRVLRIASRYLGCKPTLSSVGVRWSFPRADGKTRTQNYHRDLDDWRFFKLFIYLTDVDEESGPHTYVQGSHKTAFGLTAKAYDCEDLGQRYGAKKIVSVLGPRGTTFLADTLGIHCGISPVKRPRLILQIQYSLLPIFAFRYEPPKLNAGPFDTYSNRLLLRDNT